MKEIDGKFGIEIRNGEPVIVNIVSGVAIPDDEPLFLFRARDRLALKILLKYFLLAEQDGCDPSHITSLSRRIDSFRKFADDHPELMKQSGITRHIRAAVEGK